MRPVLPFLAFLPITMAAQTSFAPVGAKWTYKQGTVAGPDSNLAVIEVIGDTLIANQACVQLSMTQGWSTCYVVPGFLRSSGDSLWYWNDYDQRFELLFRWNAVPGDNWQTCVRDDIGPGDTLNWVVTDTGHVSIGPTVLRVMEVQVSSMAMLYEAPIVEVTERIGPGWSPFTWVSGACDAEYFTQLRCYEDDDFTWQNDLIQQCELSTGIAEHEAGPSLSLVPNPVEQGGVIRITATGQIANHAWLELIDANGRGVRSRQVLSHVTELIMPDAGLFLAVMHDGSGRCATTRIAVR